MKLISIKELADCLSVHPKTVAKWSRCGILPAIRITRGCVRFDLDACKKVLDRRTRFGGSVSIKPLILTIAFLSPFLVDFLATNWQQKTNARENSAFVNRWSSVRSRQSATPLCALKKRLCRFLRSFLRMSAWELEGAIKCF